MKNPAAGKGSLKRYELTNLFFFLFVIVALGVFVSFVFQYYRSTGEKDSEVSDANGILSEALAPGSDVGMFYLGTKLTETSHQYRTRLEVPATDDGLVRGLFDIPGVSEVIIDQRMLMIKKHPSARWEAIQPAVREVVKNHLHMHQ